MRLKENTNEKATPLDKKKITAKRLKKKSTSKEAEEINIEANKNLKDESTKKINENEEIILLDKKDEIEITDEINNSRKKRRRSSAIIE